MWNLVHAQLDAMQSIPASLAFLQLRTPTTAWDMVVGGTLPTKFVLLVLLAFPSSVGG